MERKTKVKLGDEWLDGIELDFRTIKEDWNEYEVEDGTKIKLKVIVGEIVRTNRFDHEGNPIYVVRSGNVLLLKAPESLKKPGEMEAH